MQEAELRSILTRITTAGEIRPAGDHHIKFSCLLARWNHRSGRDQRPSMTATVGPGVSILKCHTCRYIGTLADTMLRINTLTGGSIAAISLQTKAREADLALESLDFSAIGVTAGRYRQNTPDIDYTGYLMELRKPGLSDRACALLLEKGVDPDFAASQFFCATVPSDYTDPGMGLNSYRKRKRTRSECLVFPVLSVVGGETICVGAQVRPLDPSPLKYWTIWPFASGRHLFGEHFLPFLRHRPLSLVEGPFDAMHLTQLGAWAAGIHGIYLDAEKAQLIRAAEPSHVGILLDPDEAGQSAVEAVNEMLTKHGVPSMIYGLRQDPKYLTANDLATNYSSLLSTNQPQQ